MISPRGIVGPCTVLQVAVDRFPARLAPSLNRPPPSHASNKDSRRLQTYLLTIFRSSHVAVVPPTIRRQFPPTSETPRPRPVQTSIRLESTIEPVYMSSSFVQFCDKLSNARQPCRRRPCSFGGQHIAHAQSAPRGTVRSRRRNHKLNAPYTLRVHTSSCRPILGRTWSWLAGNGHR